MVPVETMQRTQSPSHTQVFVGPSEMTNEVASGLLRATTVSKVPLTQPQTPKAPKHSRASCCLAPWLLVIQKSGHSSLLEASPESQLMPTLPHRSIREELNTGYHLWHVLPTGACD